MEEYKQTTMFEEEYIYRTTGSVTQKPDNALTELIANAWDAGARNVNITIPEVEDEKIIIEDYERHANLKYKYGNRSFWCTGYYVSTVGNNKNAVYRYVENQLKEDMMTDQLTIKEYKDPFKGSWK